MLPDLVYAVRAGERNVPLRYSLRSLANLPHRRVIISGHCPSWVQNVTAVEVPGRLGKFDSIEANLRAALSVSDLAERVVYFNDDFFVMEPIDRVPVTHGGSAYDYRSRFPELRTRMTKTIRDLIIEGHREPLTYDGIHMPLPVEVGHLRSVLDEMPKGILWRTWYGNIARLGGEQVTDVKTRNGVPIPGPFLSSSARSIDHLKRHLDDVLPKESPYVV